MPMSADTVASDDAVPDDAGYRRRVRAWILYDVANSAFATTVLAAVFPVYYATVAGASLPTAATATQYYSLTLSISVVVLAVASPVLGTYADVSAAKKKLLALFAVIGILATALLFGVGEGDWLQASIIFAIGRAGFGAANVFYDALLPHVARRDDIDRVSARGFAFGYLGGGALLAVNVAMIFALPDELGTRMALLSVAIWWAFFTVPLLRRVPEPPATAVLGPDQTSWSVTWSRLRTTVGDIREAVDLRRFLLAYLVYNDAIGTVISLAAIYASELGIGTTDVILALLLVQFAGVGFSLLFGRLPERGRARQAQVAAFLIGTIVALPVLSVGARLLLPQDVSGVRPGAFEPQGGAVGEGLIGAAAMDVAAGEWARSQLDPTVVEAVTDEAQSAEITGRATTGDGALTLDFVGRRIDVTYTERPGGGTLTAFVDGAVARDAAGEPARRDTDTAPVRLDASMTVVADEAGRHTLRLESADGPVELAAVDVLGPERQSGLGVIFGLLLATLLVVGLFAVTVGKRLLRPVAQRLDTKGSIILALSAYAAVAVWGFALDSVVEFWFLALAVAVVQGGSQALSRSLYATLVPDTMSGEFFGFFSILSKFASVVSPLVFVASVALFGSSRPAVLTLAAFFVFGIAMLTRVDVARGQGRADRTDRAVRAALAEAQTPAAT